MPRVRAVLVACTLLFAPLSYAHADKRDDALDRFMITEIMYKYAIAHNTSDIEGYANLFTDDAVIYDDTMHYEFARGRSAIIAAAKSDQDHYNPDSKKRDGKLHLGKLRHNITNPVVQMNGDGTASGISYVQIVANQPGVGPVVLSQGYYRDQFIKRDGQWLIARRDIYALEMSNWGLAEKLGLKNGPGPAGKN